MVLTFACRLQIGWLTLSTASLAHDRDAIETWSYGVTGSVPRLPIVPRSPTFCRMFIVSDAERASIQAAWDSGGELAAAVELRRLFPGISDMANARRCARIVAGWTATPAPPPLKPTAPRGHG